MSSPAMFSEAQSPLTGAPYGSAGDFDMEDPSSQLERRNMQVKVLYTFDNHDKTNCLARLPGVWPIPVLEMQDQQNNRMEIGVIELKTCIQAIVSASPELLSKLEQDYTVYAYDYSEYETPIVGQGMLSKVLAYQSPTPHAAASQSGTMITGRVQRNLKALFSRNAGPPETLEVKIKLVPVPTKMRNEYDRAMDAHRMNSLSRSGTGSSLGLDGGSGEGMSPVGMNMDMDLFGQQDHTGSIGAMNSLHDMLTPNFSGDQMQDPVAYGESRPGSATQNFTMQQNGIMDTSRPSSRNSLRQAPDSGFDEPYIEDGPARKRARLMQADWQGRSNFGAQPDSLRVAASTAASIRQFRSGLDSLSLLRDQGPRAPTPVPAEKMRQGSFGSYAQSGLRNASGASSPLPMSDGSVIEDALSVVGSSPNDIPSSPPIFDTNDDFASPSSPQLPEPRILQADSGFQSDLHSDLPPEPQPNVEEQSRIQQRVNKWRDTRVKRNASLEWQVMAPASFQSVPEQKRDPVANRRALSAIGHLSTSPSKRRYRKRVDGSTRAPQSQSESEANIMSTASASQPPLLNIAQVVSEVSSLNRSNSVPTISNPPHGGNQLESIQPPQTSLNDSKGFDQPKAPASTADTLNLKEQKGAHGPMSSQSTLPPRNPLSRKGKRPRTKRALPRANTWAGPSSDNDVDSPLPLTSEANFDGFEQSDAPTPAATTLNGFKELAPKPLPAVSASLSDAPTSQASKRPSGSGVVRQQAIMNQLEQAIRDGEIPKFCNNCGQIETPTWRPYWIRSEYGDGSQIPLGPKSGIHCVEPLSRDENGKVTTYRIYKQWTHLTSEEKEGGMFEQCILCNPCGDYLRKHKTHRPKSFWDGAQFKKNAAGSFKNRKKKNAQDGTSSQVPSSDAVEPHGATGVEINGAGPQQSRVRPTLPGSTKSGNMGPPPAPASAISQPIDKNSSSANVLATPGKQSQSPSEWTEAEALLALERAIRESPAKVSLVGSKESPIDLEEVPGNGSGSGTTPKPIRRILFPSPRKDGEFKSLDGSITNNKSPTKTTGNLDGNGSKSPQNGKSDSDSARQPSQERPQCNSDDEEVNEDSEESDNKENMAPHLSTLEPNENANDNEDEWALFDFDANLNSPHNAHTLAKILKTPSKSTHVSPWSNRLRSAGKSPANGNGLGPASPSERKRKTVTSQAPRTPRNYVNPNFDLHTGLPVTPSRSQLASANHAEVPDVVTQNEPFSMTLPSPLQIDIERLFSDHNVLSTPACMIHSSTGLTPLRVSTALGTPEHNGDAGKTFDPPWWETIASDMPAGSSSPPLMMIPAAMMTGVVTTGGAEEIDGEMFRFYEDDTATEARRGSSGNDDGVLKDITKGEEDLDLEEIVNSVSKESDGEKV